MNSTLSLSVFSALGGDCLSLICENLCDPWTKKMTNKPISKTTKIAVNSLNLRTKNHERRTAKQKNKPIQTHFPPQCPRWLKLVSISVHSWFLLDIRICFGFRIWNFVLQASSKPAQFGILSDKLGIVWDKLGVILDNNGVVWDYFGNTNTRKILIFSSKVHKYPISTPNFLKTEFVSCRFRRLCGR